MMNYLAFSFLGGGVAVVYGLFLAYKIVQLPKGTPDMNKISDAIAEGAQAFLKRQYTTIGLLAVLISACMYVGLGKMSAVGFLIGAVCSAVAGFIGMNVAVRANIRTAQAAKTGQAASAELKAVYATPQDIAEGKRVAESACAGCHGIDGVSKIKDTPHIAGQRPGYLYIEMLVYQKGGRGNT